MTLRVSGSTRIGPFRFRLSAPVTGRGRVWAGASVRTGRRTRVGVSTPVGGKRRGRA
jgi:hypothetical protein